MSPNEAFSFLPALTPEEITSQVEHILQHGHLPLIEYSENPAPDDYYWRLWPLPKRGETTVSWVVSQLEACRRRYPYAHIKLSAYDTKKARILMSFMAYLPSA